MLNTPKASLIDVVKPAFKPSGPFGMGFSSPVSTASLKASRKVKAKTPATRSSRIPQARFGQVDFIARLSLSPSLAGLS